MSFVIEEEQLSYQREQRSALCINLQHLYQDLYAHSQQLRLIQICQDFLSLLARGFEVPNHVESTWKNAKLVYCILDGKAVAAYLLANHHPHRS